MKYLKIFEEYSELNYNSISQEQYEEEIYGESLGYPFGGLTEHNLIFINKYRQSFTDYEFNKVKMIIPEAEMTINVCKGKFSKMELLVRNSSWNVAGRSNGSGNAYDNSFIAITKMPDEWYYVSNTSGEAGGYNEFYKCDQFDELLELLTQIVSKIVIDRTPWKLRSKYENTTESVTGYSKIFEEYNESYENISRVQYEADIFGGLHQYRLEHKSRQPFTIDELNKIKILIPKIKGGVYDSRLLGGGVPGLATAWFDRVVGTSGFISITKMPDEWYYVSDDAGARRNEKFYKCDQFDGLLECLRKLTLNK